MPKFVFSKVLHNVLQMFCFVVSEIFLSYLKIVGPLKFLSKCALYIFMYYLIYEQNMATGTKCFKRKLIKNILIPISTDGCFTLGIILVGIQRFHWFLGGKPLWGWLEETLINQRLMGLYKIVVFGFGDFWALFFSSNENGEGNRIDSMKIGREI